MKTRGWSGWAPRIAGPLVLLLAVTLGGQASAQAAPPSWANVPAGKDVAGIPARDVTAKAPVSWTADSRVLRGPRQVSWPSGEANVDLVSVSPDGNRSTPKPGRIQAGTLPVRIATAYDADVSSSRAATPAISKASVKIHDRAAAARTGIDGLLVSIGQVDGQARSGKLTVEVGYAGFANAYGGDWSTRLRLVQLPACALSTPEVDGCQEVTPLATTNDLKAKTVTADAPVTSSGMTVMAVQSSSSGDNGSYSATPLAQAGTWNVGTQTGDFTWSTSLRMPPALGSPVPSVSFAYSSGSIDGRTATTNNQGGWIGDGWESWPGFIERRYASCNDDNPSHKTGDQCWGTSNATLSLNGHAGELIETGTPNVWRLKNDDGTRIEKLTDGSRGNGDNDNEYWKVTTIDGVQYFFGYQKLPNWSSGKPVTDSTWTVPVYGNNPGEPCYNSTFASAWCWQAWRWNLDYVLDPHGNSMAYFYNKELGWYGRDNTASQRTEYVRAGWLDRVEYGMRQNSEYASAAPMRVLFSTAERCLAGCWSGTPWASAPVASAWPDTPWDQDCAAAPCTDKISPTFWSARRLSKVNTQVRADASTYRDVESWTLRHEFLNAGDNEGSPMWLRGITHTGHVTSTGGAVVSDPEIVFDSGAEPLPNRVDGPADGRSSLTRFRIKTVTTESGGQINVAYSGPDCTRTTLPVPESNTKRCMPAFYSPAGTPTLDWFHKYVVVSVNAHDTTAQGTGAAASADHITYYDYLDAPAWHYTDDELTKPEFKTWGDWRGYGRVRVRAGLEGGQQTATETRYLRGMDGDKLPSGVRQVQMSDSWGGSTVDHEALRGFVLQSITTEGPGGAEVSSTLNAPWLSGPTATRTRNGITVNAWKTNTGTVQSRTALATNPVSFRKTKTTTDYNSDGLPVAVDSFGDQDVEGDETCLRTSYARNDTMWMIDRVSQTETLSGTCTSAGNPPAPTTVLSRSRVFYDSYVDDSSFGAAPTRGLAVRTEELDKFISSTPVYVRTSNMTYDASGRVLEAFEALGSRSATAYNVDAATGLVTSTTVTNALNQTATTHIEPAWGQPVKVVDLNNVVTDITYDGMGRSTNVWLPGRNKATQTPSLKFAYLVRSSGGPTAVTTESLLPAGVVATYRKSVVLYDGFLRQRQTQTQATGGGRTITETLHNSMGAVDWTAGAYYDSTNGAVSTSLATPSGQIPSITQLTYDSVGRQIATIFKANGAEKWRTTTTYGGDRVSVTPPVGGTATTTISDAQGQTTQLRQYKSFADVGSDDPAKFDKTSYTFSLAGQLKTVTDPAGNQWSYDYDLRGRLHTTSDPDKGTTTTVYDVAGQVQTTTSPLGTGTATTAYTYDALGRLTSMRNDSVTGNKRAEWVYDTLPNGKGKPTSATRYSGGNAYVSKVDAYDTYGRPTSTSVVLPTAESDLCAAAAPNTCTYTTTMTYRSNGALATATQPAAADLPSEKLNFGYTDVGDPSGLLSAALIYVGGVQYSKIGQLISRQYGQSGYRVASTYSYDEPSRRLIGMNVVPELKPEAANYSYNYDNAGNITKISEAPQGQTADHQCFQYDYLRRLTAAWTPGNGDCAAAKSVAALGGPAPYWHSWTLDAIGNRKTETRHAATNTTFTYSYPASGASSVRPHAVTNVTATGGQSWSRNYTYDNAGNSKTRPSSTGATQTLTWDREGHMLSLAQGSNTTSAIYDADGNRLIRKDPDGSKTLYLPGGTEVRNVGTVKTATRYYSHLGTAVAMRTAAGVQWLVSDHHGTAEMAIKASDLTVAKRRTLPYGEERGTGQGTWAPGMDKGFVGATKDPTGLTHMGAREYDPALGAFISDDPITDINDPQQMNGYAYSNNSPVTFTDPTGLAFTEGEEGGSTNTCDAQCEKDRAQANLDSVNADIEKAKKAKKQSFVDILIKEGLNLLLDMLGINDIINCFTKGDLMACGSMLLSALPIGRALKIGKSIFKAVDRAFAAFKTWKKTMAAADAVLSKADDMLNAAKSKLDDAMNKLSGAGDGCVKHSFDPDTPVLMADGTTKKIKDVQVGDEVAATDPETGQTTSRKVTKTFINLDEDLTDVTVALEDGNIETIYTTQHHPFWDATDREWTPASDLVAGHHLLTTDGTVVSVVNVRNHGGQKEMRDLTVAEIHTYYVVAGDTPVLVHNCGGGIDADGKPCKCTKGDPVRNDAMKPDAERQSRIENTNDAFGNIGKVVDNRPTPHAHTSVPSSNPAIVDASPSGTFADGLAAAAMIGRIAWDVAKRRRR